MPVGVAVMARVCKRYHPACSSLLGIGQSWNSLDASLTEGLTSNFFVVSAAGEVVTANEGALNGTVREVVLQVCIFCRGLLGLFSCHVRAKPVGVSVLACTRMDYYLACTRCLALGSQGSARMAP
jgi:hypothetical protein